MNDARDAIAACLLGERVGDVVEVARLLLERLPRYGYAVVSSGELEALERQLEAAGEYQADLEARLDLQREEARRANERAHRAELRASGEHVGYDC